MIKMVLMHIMSKRLLLYHRDITDLKNILHRQVRDFAVGQFIVKEKCYSKHVKNLFLITISYVVIKNIIVLTIVFVLQ